MTGPREMTDEAQLWRRRRDALTWGLVAVGIGVRAWQLAGGASLYLDEISVARNVADRSYGELLAPLDHAQVAPPAWLLLQRFLWSHFGTDWSLRVVAFVAAIGSLFLFRAVARRTLHGWAVPFAVGAFALGVPFIVYSAQVKQYAVDVALGLALQLMALRVVDGGESPHGPETPAGRNALVRAEWMAAALGLVAVWFSNASVFVVAGVGAALLVLAWRGELVEPRRVVVRVVLPWAIASLAAGLASRALVSPETMHFMRTFWADAGSFGPRPPFAWRDLLWPFGRLRALLAPPAGLGYAAAWPYTALTVLGTWRLWRGRHTHALVLTGPILVTLAVAALQLYPFSNRLVLFLTPSVLLALAAGAGTVARWLSAWHRLAGGAALAMMAIGPAAHIARARPVYRLQEAKPLLAWFQQQRRPGDKVFVWYRMIPNVQWYAPQLGLSLDDASWGDCHLDAPRRFLEELDPLRGHPRVWLLVAGVGAIETEQLFAYADSLGPRLAERRIGASLPGYLPLVAALYDWSDGTRLARHTAANFPLLGKPHPPQAVIACSIGPMATLRGRDARPPGALAPPDAPRSR